MLEGRLPLHVARQKLATLQGAGVAADLVPDGITWTLVLADGPSKKRLESALRQLDHCHAIILDAARREGIRLEPSKTKDPADLAAALARAWRQGNTAEALWHELVWAQGFPNGNHRTATLYVESVLNPPGSPLHDVAGDIPALERLFRDSKLLVQEKEFAPDPDKAKQDHAALARDFFARWVNRGDGQ